MKKLVLCALVAGAFFVSSCSKDDDKPVAYPAACYVCENITYDVINNASSGDVCIENGFLNIDAGFDGLVVQNTDKSPEQFIAELVASGATCVLKGQDLGEEVCYECLGQVLWNGVDVDEARLCESGGVVSFYDLSGVSIGSDYELRSSFETFLDNNIKISAECTLKE